MITYLDRLQMLSVNNSSGGEVKNFDQILERKGERKFLDDLQPINDFW